MTLRVWLAAAVLACCASAASADCKSRVLNDTEDSFASAALARLRSVGVTDLDKVGHAGEHREYDHWIVLGMDSSVFMRTQGGLLDEIGTVLSEPASASEEQKLLLFAAFTMARLSGQPENLVEDQLHQSMRAHPGPSEWAVRLGPSAAAAFTRTAKGLVIKMGKFDCD